MDTKAMCCENLATLPAEVIEEIASFLSYEDRVSLATTHSNFGHMMPWEQIVEGRELNGQFGGYNLETCETSMDVPIVTRGLLSVKMSFRWFKKWSITLGCKISLQLIRDDNVIATCIPKGVSDSGPAYKSRSDTVEVANHPVVTKARKDDILRVVMNWHGRYSVLVTNSTTRIVHKYQI